MPHIVSCDILRCHYNNNGYCYCLSLRMENGRCLMITKEKSNEQREHSQESNI